MKKSQGTLRVMEQMCEILDTDFGEIVEYIPCVKNEH